MPIVRSAALGLVAFAATSILILGQATMFHAAITG